MNWRDAFKYAIVVYAGILGLIAVSIYYPLEVVLGLLSIIVVCILASLIKCISKYI